MELDGMATFSVLAPFQISPTEIPSKKNRFVDLAHKKRRCKDNSIVYCMKPAENSEGIGEIICSCGVVIVIQM